MSGFCARYRILYCTVASAPAVSGSVCMQRFRILSAVCMQVIKNLKTLKIKLSSDTGGGWRIPGNIFLKSNFSKIRYKIAIKIKLFFNNNARDFSMLPYLLTLHNCSSSSYNCNFKFVILLYKRNVQYSIFELVHSTRGLYRTVNRIQISSRNRKHKKYNKGNF